METICKETICREAVHMHTLLLCRDAQFLGITRALLMQLQAVPQVVANSEDALAAIQQDEFDAIIVDWREIDDLADFLAAVHRSKMNRDCVLVAIVRDLLDLRQAFAAGVHFLIHKPASSVQIERCLRAAYGATVARRRKQHREPVRILASITTRTQPLAEATIVNLSEGGVGLEMAKDAAGLSVTAGEEVELRFALPESGEMLDVSGIVVWRTNSACGVRFLSIPEVQREILEQWLTDCVERSLARLCERVRAACA